MSGQLSPEELEQLRDLNARVLRQEVLSEVELKIRAELAALRNTGGETFFFISHSFFTTQSNIPNKYSHHMTPHHYSNHHIPMTCALGFMRLDFS
jgi:hypothetical protein